MSGKGKDIKLKKGGAITDQDLLKIRNNQVHLKKPEGFHLKYKLHNRKKSLEKFLVDYQDYLLHNATKVYSPDNTQKFRNQNEKIGIDEGETKESSESQYGTLTDSRDKLRSRYSRGTASLETNDIKRAYFSSDTSETSDTDSTPTTCSVLEETESIQNEEFEKEIQNEFQTFTSNKPFEVNDGSTVPFILERAIGCNVKAKFLNLTVRPTHPCVFYATSHVGVIKNYKTSQQTYLLGHKNKIENISCDLECKWLVTCDKGKDSSIIFWNQENVPVHTIFDPHKGDYVEKLCLSVDAKYLVTVGNEPDPVIKFWKWTLGNVNPEDTYVVNGNPGAAKVVSNDSNRPEHFMITFERQVVFLSWDLKDKIEVNCPKVRTKKNIGRFMCSTYSHFSSIAPTCTDKGWIIVWGNKNYTNPFKPFKYDNNKIFLKAIKVQNKSITTITAINRLFVTGDVSGHIKFYDRKLRILYWITQLELPPIVHIGFHRYHMGFSFQDVDNKALRKFVDISFDPPNIEDRSAKYRHLTESVPIDATLSRNPFIMRDFLLLTNDGHLQYVHFFSRKRDTIVDENKPFITAMDMRSQSPVICLGFASGKVKLYNCEQHRYIFEQQIPRVKEVKENQITALKFSFLDNHLSVGTSNGSFWSLHPTTLDFLSKEPFKVESDPILGIRYSNQNGMCVYWDDSRAVYIFIRDELEEIKWKFIMKVRAHHKKILDLIFIPSYDSKEEVDRMITIGEDKCLVEYNIENIWNGELNILSCTAIEQTATPISFLYYFTGKTGKFLISENKFKLKVLGNKTFEVNKTILGPTFDTPIQKMKMLISRWHEVSEYLLFATEKYIGIHHMPPDGNPFKYASIIGHPTQILDFVLSVEKTHIATIGREDSCCLFWKIDTNAVNNMMKKGGTEMAPYFTLIEGGVHGWLSKEMQDMFYYMQILDQGEDSIGLRNLTNKINIAQIPNMVRAVGFYPTEYEMRNLLKEAKKIGGYNDIRDVYEVTYEEFIKLYINHRPAFGISSEMIRQSFNIATGDESIKEEEFLQLLCENGEPFSENSFKKCLTILTETSQEERNANMNTTPEIITVNNFLFDILGITTEKRTHFHNKKINFQ